MTRGSRPRAAASADVERAAKLSRIPGVTIAEACARFGVSRSAVAQARKAAGRAPLSVEELTLAALTRDGGDHEGTLGELDMVARWIDLVHHDGCTVLDVRRTLDALCARGILEVSATRWRLLVPWP